MKNNDLKNKRNKLLDLIKSKTCEENLNLRRKSLNVLDNQIKKSNAKLNTLLDKIYNTKEIIVNNKFNISDIKSLKNLDNNALFLSSNFRKEAKNATKLAKAYNLSSFDLDTFLIELRKKKKKMIEKKNINTEVNKNKDKEKKEEIYKDDFESYKNEFNLAHTGKNKREKMKNNSFLKYQKRMRDLYNLKLELMLIEQKKKIGENRIFDEVKKAPNCLIERDKRKYLQYSRIKSRYFGMYKVSKSFELEDELMEKNILNEDNISDDENEKNNNKEKQEIFLTNQNKQLFQITKKTILKDLNHNQDLNNKGLSKKKKAFSARNINDNKKPRHSNNSAVINSPTKNNPNNLKQSIRLKLKSGININKNNNNKSNGLYKKIYQSNFRDRNSRSSSNQVISSLTSKPTLYSSKSSSRPISSLSSFNNTTYHFNPNKNLINKSMTLNPSTLSSKKSFKNYVSQINKIIRYSDYSTEKFKKSRDKLDSKKLFVKSTNKIFEKKKVLNIDKIIRNLNLDKDPHYFINDKRLIYNNSLKVKLMLNLKNREVLNTVIMTLFDEQRRVNTFYIDASLFEKLLQKYERNKVFNLLSNKLINFEKQYDKEQILEMFDKEEENVDAFFKKKETKDEDEYKFILMKNKNFKMIDKEENRKMNLKGNLYKKHLVAKYKKKE